MSEVRARVDLAAAGVTAIAVGEAHVAGEDARSRKARERRVGARRAGHAASTAMRGRCASVRLATVGSVAVTVAATLRARGDIGHIGHIGGVVDVRPRVDRPRGDVGHVEPTGCIRRVGRRRHVSDVRARVSHVQRRSVLRRVERLWNISDRIRRGARIGRGIAPRVCVARVERPRVGRVENHHGIAHIVSGGAIARSGVGGARGEEYEGDEVRAHRGREYDIGGPMRFYLPALAALALTACASDPVPRDGSTDGGSDLDAPSLDAADVPDAGRADSGSATDAPVDVGADVSPPTDAVTPLDAPDAGAPLDVVDAGSSVDASDAGTAPDTAPDTGFDAGDVLPATLRCTVSGGAVTVDPRSNPAHCGACGHNCCGGFCLDGRCSAEGPPGTYACPISPAEEAARGCFSPVRAELRSDREHCGSCDRRCASDEACSDGACVRLVIDAGLDAGPGDVPADAGSSTSNDAAADRPDAPSCALGFADCDGNPANGCEADLRSSTVHCGRCGNGCAAGQTCDTGACSIPPCAAGYGNCDGLAPNGCETDTRSSAAHCGACGHPCAAGQVCVAGACAAAPCTNDAIRCNAAGSGVERCVAGAWTLARVCNVMLSGAGASSACYLGGCVSCRGVDGGSACGPATCDDDEDCYRSGWARCIDGRCSRRGILPCSSPSDCLPWIVTGVTSACTADVSDLNGITVRSCTGSLVGPCTADHQCPSGYRCDLRTGRCSSL